MQYRLRRHEKEALRREYGENIIFRFLLTPCRSYEAEAKGFCLAAEEVFWEVMRAMDTIKESPEDANFRMKGLWNELFVDYRDLAGENVGDEAVCLSVGIVVQAIILCLEAAGGTYSTTLAMDLMTQMALHNQPTAEMMERFTANLARLGEERLREAVGECMESDVFLSDEIDDLLQSLPNPVNPQDNAEKSTKDSVDQLTNRQLMILFDLFLNKGFSPEYCNQKALATLLSRVSGRSPGSIRQKIREGVDYDMEEVKSDVRLMADLLKPIDEAIAEKMKNLIE